MFPTIVENQVQLISKEEGPQSNVKIFSSNGSLVKSFDNIDLARGIPTDYLPIINLTTGMYFVHLYDVESGAQKSAHRIIVK